MCNYLVLFWCMIVVDILIFITFAYWITIKFKKNSKPNQNANCFPVQKIHDSAEIKMCENIKKKWSWVIDLVWENSEKTTKNER